jgi:hypothetical protein
MGIYCSPLTVNVWFSEKYNFIVLIGKVKLLYIPLQIPPLFQDPVLVLEIFTDMLQEQMFLLLDQLLVNFGL